MNAGYSFVSCSQQALENNYNTEGYRLMDLILGKQKEIKTGSGLMPTRFKIYTAGLKNALRQFTAAGGCVFLSGAYVGSDLWDNAAGNNDEAGKTFVKDVLGFRVARRHRHHGGQPRNPPVVTWCMALYQQVE